MGPRPTHLDLGSDAASKPLPPRPSGQMELPSPRPGEVPPALSPLDAFALHSRILAKQFDREARNGKRVSRLPTMAVAKELANRPDYFRSISGESEAGSSTVSPTPEAEDDHSPTVVPRTGLSDVNRPVSHYPMLGNLGGKGQTDNTAATPYYDAEEFPDVPAPQDYFGVDIPRASSPEPVDPRLVNVQAPSPAAVPSLSNSYDSLRSTQPRTLTNGSTRSQRSLRSDRGLLPPKSPGPEYLKTARSIQSIRSAPHDSGDEDGSSYNGHYATSSSRKFSGSSNMSRPHSPFSPFVPPVRRSPSVTSDYSTNGAAPPLQQPRAPISNFSRPLSSSGPGRPSLGARPSFDLKPVTTRQPSTERPLRHPSGASNSTRPSTNPPSRQTSADDVRTPFANNVRIDTPGEVEVANGDLSPGPLEETDAAPSYIYAKYSLPRGRSLERNSIRVRDSWVQHQFDWEETKPCTPRKDSAPPSPRDSDMLPLEAGRQDSNASVFSAPVRPTSSTGSTHSAKISGLRLSSRDLVALHRAQRSQSAKPVDRVPKPTTSRPSLSVESDLVTDKPTLHRSSPSVKTESTGRTIVAAPQHQRIASLDLSPEEHLEIGIEEHSAGALTKSTYHLRLAAKAGLPTAMLLYALACRHGWGMRPQPEEGVLWLRRAIGGSGLSILAAPDEKAAMSSPKGDIGLDAAERRKRKVQFSLAIYELGISYMNGWGCTKDKALALRCFEVAGAWGDCDALAEAAYCYTQGTGCRKDLKKAAGLYRKAAEDGMSVAGNSWIYKAKYMDNSTPAAPSKSPEKGTTRRTETWESMDVGSKPSRARGRSIWGRRKEKG